MTGDAGSAGGESQDNLRAYFREVEDAFCRQRGAPLLLSPDDYVTVCGWFGEGVELDAVREGIADYFRRLAARKRPLRHAIVLSFAEPRVRKAHERLRLARIGKNAGHTPDPEAAAARNGDALAASTAALETWRVAPTCDPEVLRLLTPALGEAEAALADARARCADTPDLAALDGPLAAADDRITDALEIAAPSDWREAASARAAEVLADMAAGLDPARLASARRKLLRKFLREISRIPRISLFHSLG